MFHCVRQFNLLLLLFTIESHLSFEFLHTDVRLFYNSYRLLGCRNKWNVRFESTSGGTWPAEMFIVCLQVFPAEVFHMRTMDGNYGYQRPEVPMIQLCLCGGTTGDQKFVQSSESVLILIKVLNSLGWDRGFWRLDPRQTHSTFLNHSRWIGLLLIVY